MGIGYGANYADLIEQDELNKIVDGKVDKLIEVLDNDLEIFAMDIQYDGDDLEEDLFFKAEKIYHEIQEDFQNKTGLELELSYHSQEDDGDRYDNVDGAYWQVYGMYELSEAGKKMQSVVSRRFYVTFG